MDHKKTIAILGSTGSIGENTIRIIKQYPEVFKVKVLTAHSNVELLAKQALELQSEYVHITDVSKIPELKNLLASRKIKIISDIAEISSIKVDLSVIAIVGSAAIMPTINAIKAGNNIALANKECLVCAGTIITKLAKQKNVKIIPVDSEHSGLFQVFDHKNPHLIKDVILTASGGPFREYSLEQMNNVTKQQALKHPNWSMGAKITIDSASLVNKCLEVIEAYYLFPLKPEQIKILIHPESIVHAIANYTDGTMLAHLGAHNMQIPISYALFYPDRATLPEFNQFDLSNSGNLRFYKPEALKFRSLEILNTILANIETNASLIFNMANEVAVEAFLKDQINFNQITQIIEKVLEQSDFKQLGSLEEVLDSMEYTKAKASEFVFGSQKL